MPTLEEFKAKIALFAEQVVKVKDKLQTEEATKTALILPFIGLLGYDASDPTEVVPEHSADFSDKFKNRVDYAIVCGGVPAIAIECKSMGAVKKDDRGQLKSYFNAVKTIKIGILTDGAKFEFFVDMKDQNMMDGEPYLAIDFGSKADLSDNALRGLHALSKGMFDPDTVTDNAKRSIVYHALYRYLSDQFTNPDAEFTKFLLKERGFKHVHPNSMELYRAIARESFRDVFNHHVMRSLDMGGAKPQSAGETPAAMPATEAASGIVTTAAEIAAFEAIRLRLAFLAKGDPALWDAVTRVRYHDYQGKMVVYYGGEKKGRLAEILEAKDGSIRYVITDGSDPTPLRELTAADTRLGALFADRVATVKPPAV